jgi:TolA-binding protein|tara:strand:- start:1221 stop:1499 length:279 start_codon:yes stop_codon:yes gene_type:complete
MPKKTIKLQTIELDSIKEVQSNYLNLQRMIGALHLQKIQFNQQIDTINNQILELEVNFTRLREDEKTLMKNLEEKYGQGGLDLETGEFTPNK